MKYPQVVSMPSAVSNWLDEQLETRGIDAVVYTRYILSLLHSHTVDVLYPEEDFQFSHSHSKKEVRRFNRGYAGSHRSSADWWRHAHVDAERIKRSAAVECLLSASEQNCEIESLVDELCEKLKEVNNENTFPVFSSSEAITETSAESKKITPQELAEKYYAAFPPLCPQTPAEESKLLSLIPKWRNVNSSSSSSSSLLTSPVKKKSVKKACKPFNHGNRSFFKEQNDMKGRNQTKQRLSCLGRNKNMRNNGTFNNWDLSMLTNNNIINFSSLKQKEDPSEKEETDQCIHISKDIWNNEEDEMNMYEDLPVDIIDLLDSPRPHDDTVEMMNIANMRDTGKRRFIPYGTNIMSSIWSTDQDITFDNNYNTTIDASSQNNNTITSELTLDYKFSTISIDNPSVFDKVNFDDWPPANSSVENETNALFENSKKSRRRLFANDFNSLPEDWSVNEKNKETEADKEIFEAEKFLAFSLMKLNHNKEKSCFRELSPGSISQAKSFDPFGKPSNAFNLTAKYNSNYLDNTDKEDLLTSERSYFKPICEKTDNEVPQQSKYDDGTTFVISNNFEKIDYKKSESGTMFLETESGQSKKYYEYKPADSTTSLDLKEFVLKFTICENNKACQTENCALDEEVAMYNNKVANTMKYYDSPQPNACNEEQQIQNRCTCPGNITSASNNENSTVCPIHVVQRPESILNEVVWKYEEKSCGKCHNNAISCNDDDWSTGNKGQMDSDWDENGLRSIWSGGEVCQKCLNPNGSNPQRPAPNHQLREDISQDGEQLLSDLSTIQKCYNDDLPTDAEQSFDITELISDAGVHKERKRRHSLIVDGHVDAWSFASRFEEDCIMQLVTFPASRAVTL